MKAIVFIPIELIYGISLRSSVPGEEELARSPACTPLSLSDNQSVVLLGLHW